MKEYLHMDDVFDLRLMDACKLSVKPSCVWSAWDDGVTPHEYAAHAINSHDELVEMNKELLELVREMLNSGTFFISAVESDSFGVDFSDWEKRAAALVSSIQEKSA